MQDQREKLQTLSKLLLDEYALIHLATTKPGVSLPPHLLESSTVTLKLSKLFRGNLEIGDSEVRAELLFSGKYFTCVVPYEALWGMTSQKGEKFLWPASIPEDLLGALNTPTENASTEQQPPPTAPPSQKLAKRQIKHLKRVK